MAVQSDRIRAIIAEQLGVKQEEVTDQAKFIDDLGADSLDTVELVMALEEEFSIEIPDEDAEKMVSVGDAIKYIEEKAAKYNLQPVALGLFGGVYNYNKEPWYAKKAMEMDRPRIEAAYKEMQPGIYDTRDWNAIRSWAKELAQKAK